MIVPHPYQEQGIKDIRAAVKRSESCVYVLPTAGGKTVIASEIARRAAAKGTTTMFLVHRRELVQQAINTLTEAVPGMSIGVEAPGFASIPWAKLQVGMVQSLVRRETTQIPDLVFVDEAHHVRADTWEATLSRWPNAKLVGLTATPQRLDGKGLGKHFREMVLGPSIPELVDGKYLAPCRTLHIPKDYDLNKIRTDKHGEYLHSELSKHVNSVLIADMVKLYQSYTPNLPAIFFGIDTSHSRNVCEGLRDRGFSAEHVDGKDTDARRDRVMNGFRDRGIEIVGNCDLISEGFDAPGCYVVIVGRPTKSVTRWLQMNGRGMRYEDGKEMICLDPFGVCHVLGLPDEVRQWSLEDGEIRSTSKEKTKTCRVCMTVFYGMSCPHCGSKHVPSPAEYEEVEVELEEAKPSRKKTGFRKDLWRDIAIARRSENPRKELLAIAKKRGYKQGWVNYVIRAWENQQKES